MSRIKTAPAIISIDMNGFEKVIDEIRKLFDENRDIVIETTGASDDIRIYYEKLKNHM